MFRRSKIVVVISVERKALKSPPTLALPFIYIHFQSATDQTSKDIQRQNDSVTAAAADCAIRVAFSVRRPLSDVMR